VSRIDHNSLNHSTTAETGWIDKSKSALAKTISVLFHPGFQQYYILMWLASQQGIFLQTLPAATIFILAWPSIFYIVYKKKILKDDSIYQMARRDRFWPIMVNLIGLALFLGAHYGIHLLTAPSDAALTISQAFSHTYAGPLSIYTMILILMAINTVSILITSFYKISLHMLGTASVVFIYFFPDQLWITALIATILILSVGWSRLYLRGHTMDEVVVGTTVGLILACGALLYLGWII
jgi:membrane-associated phospholipid phosphatase